MAKAFDSASTDLTLLHALLYLTRKTLQQDKYVPLAVELGLTSRLISVLDLDSPILHSQTIWGLINMTSASNESVKEILAAGAHRKVLSLMNKSSPELFEDVTFNMY